MEEVPEVPATCTTTGTKSYWICTECNEMYSDANGEYAITEPVVIPATGRTLEKTEAKDASIGATGNSEYWTCSVCNTVFSDEGITVTTEEAMTIAMVDASALATAVNATYTEEATDSTLTAVEQANLEATGYTDVAESDWHADAVAFVVESGLFNGVSSNSFAPDETMPRAIDDCPLSPQR